MELESQKLTGQIIGAAIEVHRVLGPGLLESAYEECLCYELKLPGLSFERQTPLPLRYKEISLDCGYRIDVVVERKVVVEIKCVAKTSKVHEAQLLTYMRLGGYKVGLIVNFHVSVLRHGIVRRVL